MLSDSAAITGYGQDVSRNGEFTADDDIQA